MPSFGVPCEAPDPQYAKDLAEAITEYVNCLMTQLMMSVNDVVDENQQLINNITTTMGGPVTGSSSSIQELITAIQGIIATPSSQSATNIVNIGPITENHYETPATIPQEQPVYSPTIEVSPTIETPETPSVDTTPAETPEITVESPVNVTVIEPVPEPVDMGSASVAGYGASEPAPNPPKAFGAFACPKAPSVFGVNAGVIGTPEWCLATESMLDWLDTLYATIIKWLRDKALLTGVMQALIDQLPANDDTSTLGIVKSQLIGIMVSLTKAASTVFETLLDITECSLYYTKVMLPIRRPNSYAGLVAILNLVKWVDGSRIGSQSYLGITIATNLTIPQLEEYLQTLMRYLCPTEIPGVDEIGDIWRKGYISTEHRDCLLNLNGASPVLWDQFIRASGDNISPREAIQWARREGGDFAAQLDALGRVGVSDPDVASQMLTLYDELPTIADHLHWLQRNVFNDEYVQRYRLLDGFEERFWTKFGDDLTAQGYTKQRASYEYAAHWIMPAPTQLREFYYRLRSDKMAKGHEFTLDDFKRILAEQDYNPLAAQWLADTIDRLPTQQQLKDMRANGIIDENEYLSGLMDLGYNEDDATGIRANETYSIKRQRASSGHGWTPTALAKAFIAGSITRDEVAVGMEYLGYKDYETTALLARAQSDLQYTVTTRARSRLMTSTVKQVRDALHVGVMDVSQATTTLQSIGWSATNARGIAELEQQSASMDSVKKAIQRLRSAYFQGEVDGIYCRQHLALLGIVQLAIDRYLAAWQIEQTPRRKRRTAAQISNDVAEGQLDTATALVQLRNLGYDDADSRLFIADAQRDLIHTTAEAVKGVHFGGRGGVSIMTQAGQQSVTLNKRIVAWLMRQEPPAKLLAWANAGIISADYARNRLALYGWDEASIEKWIASIKPAKPKAATTGGKP